MSVAARSRWRTRDSPFRAPRFWDGPVIRQRARRIVRHLAHLSVGIAYRCACARELGSAPLGASERLSGYYRNGITGHRANRAQRAWRVQVGDDGTLSRSAGLQSQAL
jgi:hypothetical protein